MHGKDITALCLLMVRQVQGNLTPWLAMGKIRVNIDKIENKEILNYCYC